MNVTEDVYLKIAKEADDRTVLKMLSTNKNFDNPAFFQEVFRFKYPFLEQYKKEDESWRKFYVRMILYMSKLKEMGVMFSPFSNPEQIYYKTVGSGTKSVTNKNPKVPPLNLNFPKIKDEVIMPLSPNFPTKEYEEDIINFLKTKEKPNPILPEALNVKRRILVGWLIEVCEEYRFKEKTLHLSINLLDRFLYLNQDITNGKLQLLGCACVLIASKYEETYKPGLDDFVYISDYAFSRTELKQMESVVLKALEWKITEPTCIDFAEFYQYKLKLTKEQIFLSDYVMESSLTHTHNYLPSLVAAASIFYALMTKNIEWSNEMEKITGYSNIELKSVLPSIVTWITTSNKEAKEKFSRANYDKVALKAPVSGLSTVPSKFPTVISRVVSPKIVTLPPLPKVSLPPLSSPVLATSPILTSSPQNDIRTVLMEHARDQSRVDSWIPILNKWNIKTLENLRNMNETAFQTMLKELMKKNALKHILRELRK